MIILLSTSYSTKIYYIPLFDIVRYLLHISVTIYPFNCPMILDVYLLFFLVCRIPVLGASNMLLSISRMSPKLLLSSFFLGNCVPDLLIFRCRRTVNYLTILLLSPSHDIYYVLHLIAGIQVFLTGQLAAA